MPEIMMPEIMMPEITMPEITMWETTMPEYHPEYNNDAALLNLNLMRSLYG